MAEARLGWDTASWLKWPLLAAAAGAAVFTPATAAFLILLVPLLSDVAAREDLHGTRGLVFSQPGIPGSRVLWKAGAIALIVMTLGLPAIVRALATSFRHAAAMATGLLFTAALATAAGSISRGGKLFAAVFTPLWYVGLSGAAAGPFDLTGAFGGNLGTKTRLAYLAATAVALGIALAVERRRRSWRDVR